MYNRDKAVALRKIHAGVCAGELHGGERKARPLWCGITTVWRWVGPISYGITTVCRVGPLSYGITTVWGVGPLLYGITTVCRVGPYCMV